MFYKLNKIICACATAIFLMVAVQQPGFAQAEQACLIKGQALNGEELTDCVINVGIDQQKDLAKFCYDYTELRSSYVRNPEPQIVYMAVCPAAEQAQCDRPADENVQVLFYDRTPSQLALEQEYCDLLAGEWSDENTAEKNPIGAIDERYNLCNYLEGKTFVSLQRFTYGLSLLSYHWKLEFNSGKLMWRKSGDQTELAGYRCEAGEITVKSLETGDEYQLDASIYSNSVTFDGVAYDQSSR